MTDIEGDILNPICEPLPGGPQGSAVWLLPEPGTVISVPVAAHLLGISPMTFWRWVQRGTIRLLPPGRHGRVLLASLEALVGKHFTVLDLHKATRLHAEYVAKCESQRRAKA